MLRIVHIIAGLGISLSAAAATDRPMIKVKEEVPLLNVAAEPTNAGINPEARAYIVSGQVMLGSNSCFAQGLHGKLRVENQADGTRQVVAYVEGRQRAGLICIEIFQPVYADVSITVRGGVNLAENVFVRNAEEMGTLLPLSSFTETSAVSECSKPVFCTKEYMPTTCSISDAEFKGNNRCEALAAVKEYACRNDIEFLAEEVECQSRPGIAR